MLSSKTFGYEPLVDTSDFFENILQCNQIVIMGDKKYHLRLHPLEKSFTVVYRAYGPKNIPQVISSNDFFSVLRMVLCLRNFTSNSYLHREAVVRGIFGAEDHLLDLYPVFVFPPPVFDPYDFIIYSPCTFMDPKSALPSQDISELELYYSHPTISFQEENKAIYLAVLLELLLGRTIHYQEFSFSLIVNQSYKNFHLQNLLVRRLHLQNQFNRANLYESFVNSFHITSPEEATISDPSFWVGLLQRFSHNQFDHPLYLYRPHHMGKLLNEFDYRILPKLFKKFKVSPYTSFFKSIEKILRHLIAARNLFDEQSDYINICGNTFDCKYQRYKCDKDNEEENLLENPKRSHNPSFPLSNKVDKYLDDDNVITLEMINLLEYWIEFWRKNPNYRSIRRILTVRKACFFLTEPVIDIVESYAASFRSLIPELPRYMTFFHPVLNLIKEYWNQHDFNAPEFASYYHNVLSGEISEYDPINSMPYSNLAYQIQALLYSQDISIIRNRYKICTAFFYSEDINLNVLLIPHLYWTQPGKGYILREGWTLTKITSPLISHTNLAHENIDDIENDIHESDPEGTVITSETTSASITDVAMESSSHTEEESSFIANIVENSSAISDNSSDDKISESSSTSTIISTHTADAVDAVKDGIDAAINDMTDDAVIEASEKISDIAIETIVESTIDAVAGSTISSTLSPIVDDVLEKEVSSQIHDILVQFLPKDFSFCVKSSHVRLLIPVIGIIIILYLIFTEYL